jgi:hypothetical protein
MMNRFLSLTACAALLCFLLPRPSTAQDERSLEETLNMLSADAATQYLAPISSSFGANLNSGWFHRAPRAVKFGINFEAGVVAMGSFYPKDADKFDVAGTFRFSDSEANTLIDLMEDQQNINIDLIPGARAALIDEITSDTGDMRIYGATIIGAATDSVTVGYLGGVYDVGGTPYTVPEAEFKLPFGGFGELASINLTPLAVPQFSVGTIWGTQFTLRYLPAIEVSKELGDFTYTGFGIQHNPAVWLDLKLPVDLAASFFTQQMKIGDLFTCKATAMGVNASKTFGWRFLNLTPYAGLMYENATMEVAYDFVVETVAGPVVQPIKLDLESKNSSRLTVGLNARLGIVNWNVDYSLAEYSAISTGVTLAF